MRTSSLSLEETALQLKRHQLYTLIMVYRWLALLPPTLNLLLTEITPGLALLWYGLAWANALLQTLIFFNLRGVLKKDFIYEGNTQTPGNLKLMLPLIFELLLCALLNALPDSPYFLYSLAPILTGAFFFGSIGALTCSFVLSSSYLAARITALVVNAESIKWLPIVTNLACFFLVAVLSGYLLIVTEQLRKYATIIRRYQGNLERQNQSLEQTNQQLEYVSDFGRVIGQGRTIAQVEQLAQAYLTRLLVNRSAWRSKSEQDISHAANPVQLLRDNEVEEWLNLTHHPVNPDGHTVQSKPGVRTIVRESQPYWFAPLVYQGEQIGAIVLPNASSPSPTADKLEQEENLLVSLLADQLANVLGSLKQTQALAIEAERTRLAMDMHDVVAQSLFGMAYSLDATIKRFDEDPQASRQRLSDLRTLAFDTLANVRAIIYDLWDEETGETDFATFLQAYLKKAGKLYPFKINLEVKAPGDFSDAEFKLERDSQKSLYRLVQEALSNVAKHSGATEVWLRLARTPSEVRLEVQDNGCGFDVAQTTGQLAARPAQTSSSIAFGGMGLQTMRERLEQVGGQFKVESLPGKGTKVVAVIPIFN